MLWLIFAGKYYYPGGGAQDLIHQGIFGDYFDVQAYIEGINDQINGALDAWANAYCPEAERYVHALRNENDGSWIISELTDSSELPDSLVDRWANL